MTTGRRNSVLRVKALKAKGFLVREGDKLADTYAGKTFEVARTYTSSQEGGVIVLAETFDQRTMRYVSEYCVPAE